MTRWKQRRLDGSSQSFSHNSKAQLSPLSLNPTMEPPPQSAPPSVADLAVELRRKAIESRKKRAASLAVASAVSFDTGLLNYDEGVSLPPQPAPSYQAKSSAGDLEEGEISDGGKSGASANVDTSFSLVSATCALRLNAMLPPNLSPF